MDIKIVLLLVLGVSFLFFGCAGKKANPDEGVKYDEIESTEPDDPAPPAEEASDDDSTDVEETEEDGSDMEDGTQEEESDEEEMGADEETEELADLFVVDTDKPLEGEGFDVESPEQD